MDGQHQWYRQWTPQPATHTSTTSLRRSEWDAESASRRRVDTDYGLGGEAGSDPAKNSGEFSSSNPMHSGSAGGSVRHAENSLRQGANAIQRLDNRSSKQAGRGRTSKASSRGKTRTAEEEGGVTAEEASSSRMHGTGKAKQSRLSLVSRFRGGPKTKAVRAAASKRYQDTATRGTQKKTTRISLLSRRAVLKRAAGNSRSATEASAGAVGAGSRDITFWSATTGAEALAATTTPPIGSKKGHHPHAVDEPRTKSKRGAAGNSRSATEASAGAVGAVSRDSTFWSATAGTGAEALAATTTPPIGSKKGHHPHAVDEPRTKSKRGGTGLAKRAVHEDEQSEWLTSSKWLKQLAADSPFSKQSYYARTRHASGAGGAGSSVLDEAKKWNQQQVKEQQELYGDEGNAEDGDAQAIHQLQLPRQNAEV